MRGNSPALSIGVVVLTDGRRSDALAEMVESLARQSLDEYILVANGTSLASFHGWKIVTSSTNLGVPGGRSLGMANAKSDVLVFLDDDSLARSSELVAQTRTYFETHHDLGALAFRVVVRGTDEPLQRWTPAHRPTVEAGLADAATFPGNGHALRMAAVEQVGGYTNQFFFKHEETELAWRLLDAGWNVAYASELVVEHPNTPESRNPIAQFNGTRNKIWLARLLLPRPLSWCTIAVATTLAFVRVRSLADIRTIMSASRAGLEALPANRQPMRWATVRSLARRGRLPLR